MGWGANQWLRVTKEASYGVFDGSAAAGDIWWVRLTADNAFTMRSVPARKVIRSADGGNRRVQQTSSFSAVSGNLQTVAYPSQMADWLGMALTLTSNDLASYTFDFWDTVQAHRFLGVKCASLSLPSSAGQDYCTLSLSLVGKKRDASFTTLAAPAFSVFPTDIPYRHVETKGNVSVGGSVLANYKSCGVTIKNTLVGTQDEDSSITALYYAGRDVDGSISPQYASATLRAAFEAQTALSLSLAWLRPGTGNINTTLNLEGVNHVASVDDDLPIGGAAYQGIAFEAFYDSTASTDCSFTVAVNS